MSSLYQNGRCYLIIETRGKSKKNTPIGTTTKFNIWLNARVLFFVKHLPNKLLISVENLSTPLLKAGSYYTYSNKCLAAFFYVY
jgi:hypothetical protein